MTESLNSHCITSAYQFIVPQNICNSAALFYTACRDFVNALILVFVTRHVYVLNLRTYCGESSDFDIQEEAVSCALVTYSFFLFKVSRAECI